MPSFPNSDIKDPITSEATDKVVASVIAKSPWRDTPHEVEPWFRTMAKQLGDGDPTRKVRLMPFPFPIAYKPTGTATTATTTHTDQQSSMTAAVTSWPAFSAATSTATIHPLTPSTTTAASTMTSTIPAAVGEPIPTALLTHPTPLIPATPLPQSIEVLPVAPPSHTDAVTLHRTQPEWWSEGEQEFPFSAYQ